MRVLVAPDKFKGTATAEAVTQAIASVVEAAGHVAVPQPMADGGEGTLEAFGGANRTTTVTGPLGDPVEAAWRLGSKRTAVIEMARASGLTLVGGPEGNDPLSASTTGTGELIDAAVGRGADHIIVAVGGSATTDGGWGAIQALVPTGRLRGLYLQVACDVRTSFVDAAAVFGPQKGASAAQVKLLTRRLERLVQVYEEQWGVDVSSLTGAGAAGGLAGGLAALGAQLSNGFEVVADAVGLYDQIETVDLVITGEGAVDATSFEGKVVGGVAALAADAGVPAVAIAGRVDPEFEPPIPVHTLEHAVGLDAAMTDPLDALTQVARQVVAVAGFAS